VGIIPWVNHIRDITRESDETVLDTAYNAFLCSSLDVDLSVQRTSETGIYLDTNSTDGMSLIGVINYMSIYVCLIMQNYQFGVIFVDGSEMCQFYDPGANSDGERCGMPAGFRFDNDLEHVFEANWVGYHFETRSRWIYGLDAARDALEMMKVCLDSLVSTTTFLKLFLV